jgi:hypothetical protein
MTSFYLTRPKIPLAAALSQMLENIELELAQALLHGSVVWRRGVDGI